MDLVSHNYQTGLAYRPGLFAVEGVGTVLFSYRLNRLKVSPFSEGGGDLEVLARQGGCLSSDVYLSRRMTGTSRFYSAD